ncbi:hypothetical protein BH09BAC6_BH09BAC6_03990 [soil metagenome]|jgi:hypothetical protein
MKTILLALSLIIAGSAACFAQCEKTSTFTASKRDEMDAAGTVQKTEEEKIIISITKSNITIELGDEGRKMAGPIKSSTCDWKTPYKEGKSVLKTTLSDEGGDEKNATITIEGKDGKIVLTFEMDEMPDRKIRVTADKFEEKS